MTNFFQAALQKIMTDRRIKQKDLAEQVEISIPYMNDLVRGRKIGQESVRRRIATALGYNDYETFLDIGREALGQEPLRYPHDPERPTVTSPDFLVVPYSDHMVLNGTPPGPAIEVTKDRNCSPVMVYKPALGHSKPDNLQAFLVKTDTADPIISQGSIVIADLTNNKILEINDGAIYILRKEPGPGECSLYRLRWVEKGYFVALESPNPSCQTIYRRHYEIQLVGQVIWSIQTHNPPQIDP